MLGHIWQFVKDPVNFAVIAAIAGGAWAVFVYFHPAPEAKTPPVQKQIEAECGSVAIGGMYRARGSRLAAATNAQRRGDDMRGIVPALGFVFALAFSGAHAQERPPVHAEEGSVAIGGNVSNSTIGVPYEKLEEAVRSRTKDLEDLSGSEKETIALLKEKLDLNQRQVKSALEILGEANVPPERLAAKLGEIAERYKDLRTVAAAQPGDDAKVAVLKTEAQKAIQDGELGNADEILAAIEKIQTKALDRLALNAAQTTAKRGDVALTRLRYLDAAQRFAEAAAKAPQGHDDERWEYLNKEANAFYRQGDEFGDRMLRLWRLSAIDISLS